VVNVGRLTIQKGLPNLLHAFKEVLKRSPKTFLLLVGDGEQKFELIDLAADLGIADKVFFAGFQRGKAYRDAYTVADLFVMPSISEPFGLVALESIGYGTPVLVSHQSGVSEVIHNCLKVDFWDTNEMANQIVAVVQNDSLRDELHANSHREYMNHSWDQSADKLWDVYFRHTEGATT
jgi:glycosyltransferase involved in cell wall biosynthesis